MNRFIKARNVVVALGILAVITVVLINVLKDKYPHVYLNEKLEIMFDSELNPADVFNQGVVVKDEEGNEVSVNLRQYEYNKRIIVIEPPLGGYKSREIYTLNIGSKLGYSFEGKGTGIKEYTFRAVKDKKLSFKDPNFEKAIRAQLEKPEGSIYISDVYKLKNLNAQNYGIYDISGIDYFEALHELYLDDNKINNIKEIKKLSQLKILSLTNNDIQDISSLSKLKNLETLWLTGNEIKDFKATKEYYEGLKQKDFLIE